MRHALQSSTCACVFLFHSSQGFRFLLFPAEEIFATKEKPKEKEKTIFDDLENDNDDFITQSEVIPLIFCFGRI